MEHDVTDLTSLFLSPQTGEAIIGNSVGVHGGVSYNGTIYANAALEFYPVSWQNPAPLTADIVVPINGGGGDAGTLNTTSNTISQTLNLPTNVERVYLDGIAQSQSNDEFWYYCVPNDQTSTLESCGNTAFRETEIWLDGKPAGIAPGIDSLEISNGVVRPRCLLRLRQRAHHRRVTHRPPVVASRLY